MKVELCVASLEALDFAMSHADQIDRIELCQNLEQGGVTPSLAFIARASKNFETHVLIRPRAGHFVYSSQEQELQFKDMELALEAGAHGLVVGALTAAEQLDLAFVEEVRYRFPNVCLTFHRAIDVVPDWQTAVDALLSCGFERLLTSGQAASWENGRETLLAMRSFLRGRMELMVGGGVSPDNVRDLVQLVRPDGIHFSATEKQLLAPASLFESMSLVFDPAKAEAMLSIIHA